MIRKKPAPHVMRGAQRFSLATNAERVLRGDHAQRIESSKQSALAREGACLKSTTKPDYFDEILTQSSWARVFSLFQSADATSQFTMVRLAAATWPLATLDVCIES